MNSKKHLSLLRAFFSLNSSILGQNFLPSTVISNTLNVREILGFSRSAVGSSFTKTSLLILA